MKLIEEIKKNKSLQFFDVETLQSKSFLDFKQYSFINSNEKQLCFLYLDNSLDSIEAFFGFYSNKHALVLLSKELNIALKLQLEEKYCPAFIYDLERDFIDKYSKIENVFKRNFFEQIKIEPNIKILLSTSGTTGSPKLVKLTDENICQNAVSICQYLPLNSNSNTPLNLPIYYSYGLSVLTTSAMQGGTVYCGVKDLFHKEFWIDFEKYKFSSLAGVPYIYEMLNRIGFTKKQYPTLKYLTQAGGKLNEKLVTIFKDFSLENKIDFFVMYGQTEATARMSYLHLNKFSNKLGSVGKAILNGKFKIDENNNELIYEGPNVFGGYAESHSDLETLSKNISLRTGDLANIDDDGFVYITGRLKRFLKLVGSRINLDEVEQVLKNKFVNQTFLCVGKEDIALMIFSPDEVNASEVYDFIKSLFGIHPAFIKVKKIESVPFTNNGKVDYSVIQKM